MTAKTLTKEQMQQAVDVFAAYGEKTAAAVSLGMNDQTFRHRLRMAERSGFKPSPTIPKPTQPEKYVDLAAAIKTLLMKSPVDLRGIETALNASTGNVLDALDKIKSNGLNLIREGDRYAIVKVSEQSYLKGSTFELVSRPDNTFLFGAVGDQHIGSKYHREDVNRDLYDKFERHEVQAAFNTGNWIDGEASFNRYDILAHGLDAQAKLMSEIFPKKDFPTYAVWGDDHEGWYAQREGIDVGSYVEGIMRHAGHNWHDLGFMEAHIKLVNANTGKSSILGVVHPGGGSSYAHSYRPQKIIESYEGGEKPAVVLYGHYHKHGAGNVRNVWWAQTGTTQDQTPFMRKKSLEAHVGGIMVGLEQDPETGAITGFTPSLWRYFDKAYYGKSGQANNRWSKHGAVSQAPRGYAP